MDNRPVSTVVPEQTARQPVHSVQQGTPLISPQSTVTSPASATDAPVGIPVGTAVNAPIVGVPVPQPAIQARQTADLLQFPTDRLPVASDMRGPPVWQKDSGFLGGGEEHCTQCNIAFGMFKRKHHCRNCGSLGEVLLSACPSMVIRGYCFSPFVVTVATRV
jgi:hypothetical protein